MNGKVVAIDKRAITVEIDDGHRRPLRFTGSEDDLTRLATYVADLASRVENLETRVSDLLSRRHQPAPLAPGFRDGTGVDGRPLRAYRIAAGWTCGELGAALSTSKGRVSLWERGARKIPQNVAEELMAVFEGVGLAPPPLLAPDVAAQLRKVRLGE